MRRWVKYLIGIPLIFALLLSVLNAIMGVARSLFQAAEDRLLPKFFEHQNKHHVPDRAMAFNVVCAIIVSLFGSPVRIYIFSNVGYLVAVCASLYGYFIMRQFQPERVSPFRMPYWFRWVALACALFLTFDYFVGGWNSPDIVVGPGLRALPLHPGPGHRGRLRPALLVAQDERQAPRHCALRRDAAGRRVAGRHRPRRSMPGPTVVPEGLPSMSTMQAETEL